MDFALKFHTTKEIFALEDGNGNSYMLTVELLDNEFWENSYAKEFVGLVLEQVFFDEEGIIDSSQTVFITDEEMRNRIGGFVVLNYTDKFNHYLEKQENTVEREKKRSLLSRLLS